MKVTLTVPGSEAVLVEFPGFVKNTNAATSSLGGIRAISAAAGTDVQKEAELSLQPRAGDQLAHPIVGDRQPSKGLLLRVTKRQGLGDTGVDPEVTAVAYISSTFQFNSLADFQYTSSDLSSEAAQVPGSSGPIGWEPEPALYPPPVFSRVDSPADYGFRSFFGGDPDTYKAGLGGMGAAGRMAAHVASFNSVDVPGPWHVHGDREDMGLSKDRREVLQRVKVLFQDRPIWSAAEVAEKLSPQPAPADLELVMPRLAFIFRNGPWQGLWTRRGYDPRLDESAKRWQALHVSIPSSWYHHTSQGTRTFSDADVEPLQAESLAQVHSFERIPNTPTTVLQVGCLQDTAIQTTINARTGTTNKRQCHPITGWFTAAAWEKINNRLQKRFKLLVLGTTSQGKTQPPAEQEQELLGLEDGAAPPAAADNGSAPMDVDH